MTKTLENQGKMGIFASRRATIDASLPVFDIQSIIGNRFVVRTLFDTDVQGVEHAWQFALELTVSDALGV